MFRFTRFPPHSLCIQLWVAKHYSDGVSPFGYSRINALLQLPWTFRRLRVLLRQLVPRHSSHTLSSFQFNTNSRSLSSSARCASNQPLCNFQRSWRLFSAVLNYTLRRARAQRRTRSKFIRKRSQPSVSLQRWRRCQTV